MVRTDGDGTNQFAAMMGFPQGLTRLDLGLCLIFAFEERFFFFWSSRPMVDVGNSRCALRRMGEKNFSFGLGLGGSRQWGRAPRNCYRTE